MNAVDAIVLNLASKMAAGEDPWCSYSESHQHDHPQSWGRWGAGRPRLVGEWKDYTFSRENFDDLVISQSTRFASNSKPAWSQHRAYFVSRRTKLEIEVGSTAIGQPLAQLFQTLEENRKTLATRIARDLVSRGETGTWKTGGFSGHITWREREYLLHVVPSCVVVFQEGPDRFGSRGTRLSTVTASEEPTLVSAFNEAAQDWAARQQARREASEDERIANLVQDFTNAL